MSKIGDRFRNGWNAFMGRDPTYRSRYYGSSARPDRTRLSIRNARSIVTSIYNRIAVDVSAMNINHVRLDENGKYKETIHSDLNNALTLDANVDQTGRAMIQDAVMSMFDEGCVSLIPVDADFDPVGTDSYKIYTIRTGKIVEWYPQEVRVEAYDERIGKKKEIVLDKGFVPIIENPFYAIMNEPNSTLQRLLRVINQLEKMNDQISAGKMDVIIQLPFGIKSQAKRVLADQRRKDLEEQLTGSQYGVGYIDATEKVIQLNRPLENNLWNQAKDLTVELYNQLGLTQSIFDGTADEKTLINYYNRTITPIVTAIVEEMQRKWLSKTARTQGQAIRFFQDPFKLVTVGELAEMSDKLTRNEIMTSNEIRAVIGLKPSDDPKADELRNSNLNHPDEKVENKEEVDVSNIVKELAHGYLAHHGIQGQKWGKRNGPPYPLQPKVDQTIVKRKNSYQFQDSNGSVVSELKYYDYKMKNFDWILIADVETKSSYRGKGLATKLLNNMYSDVIEKKNPNKGVYLFVKDDNTTAINLYNKLGFDTVKTYSLDGQNKGDYLIMAKGNADIKQFDKMNFS